MAHNNYCHYRFTLYLAEFPYLFDLYKNASVGLWFGEMLLAYIKTVYKLSH